MSFLCEKYFWRIKQSTFRSHVFLHGPKHSTQKELKATLRIFSSLSFLSPRFPDTCFVQSRRRAALVDSILQYSCHGSLTQID
jgi:hypothetical protein